MSKSSWDPRTARAFLATVIPIVRVAAWAGHTLQLAERGGERCGGPVLLAGLVLGLGVVELSSGALGQTSRFSLELLSLLVLQLLGPMLVTLIAMALLLPSWLERGLDRRGSLGPSLLASALVGALLLLLFLTAALTGGVLASPRADLVAELRDVLAGVLLSDLLRSTLRAAFFLAVLCGWSQIRGGRRLRRDLTPAAEHRHQPAARECRHRTGSPRHAPPAQPHRQQR